MRENWNYPANYEYYNIYKVPFSQGTQGGTVLPFPYYPNSHPVRKGGLRSSPFNFRPLSCLTLVGVELANIAKSTKDTITRFGNPLKNL